MLKPAQQLQQGHSRGSRTHCECQDTHENQLQTADSLSPEALKAPPKANGGGGGDRWRKQI